MGIFDFLKSKNNKIELNERNDLKEIQVDWISEIDKIYDGEKALKKHDYEHSELLRTVLYFKDEFDDGERLDIYVSNYNEAKLIINQIIDKIGKHKFTKTEKDAGDELKHIHVSDNLHIFYNGIGFERVVIAYTPVEVKNGLHKYFHENGKLSQEVNYKDDIKNGSFKVYDENGNLKVEGNFKEGVQEGYWKFFEDGSLNQEGLYKDDKQHGVWKIYHKNGQIVEECNWNNGNRDGVLKQFLENGELLREVNFKNGVEI